ncbi:MAG TPA: branched-chain amino acid ABC transporter permease [Chloroflexi bacterium]|nr:branched-chain amino acid ABC transporter permease [Chloroflexota bacterium]HHW86051.1 branched-chain amino acid ABC transporter permease [Chloroflexota bacterium]
MTFSPELIAQSIITGIMIGGVFALISVGLSLIWGVMRIINFAHGEFLMVAMYIAYFLVARGGWDPYATLLVTTPALFLLGALIFRGTIRPILGHPSMNQIMLTVGLSLILQNLALVFFKADVLTTRTEYTRMILSIGPVIIRVPQLIAFIGSALTAFLLYWYLQRTDTGRAIRAAAQNKQAATLMGVDVQRIYLLAFGIGSATLGVAASLMISFYYTSPTVGLFFGLIAYVVVVLGGLGNFLGTLVAGLIIGLTESVGAAILPGSLSRVLTFALFILVLLFRPQGLFGGKRA